MKGMIEEGRLPASRLSEFCHRKAAVSPRPSSESLLDVVLKNYRMCQAKL